MTPRSFFLLVLVLVLVALGLAPAADATPAPRGPAAAMAVAKARAEAQALITPVDRPITSLFQPTTADASVEPAAALLFESLLERHWQDGRFVPSLAKRYEVSKDKLRYTFWLDPAARFWDGTPVTAEDVKFSHDLYEMEGVDTEPWFTHYLFVKEVIVKGKDQVQFVVDRPSFAHFAAVATLKIYAKKHYLALHAKDKTLRKPESVRDPMGSGPWKLEAMTDDGEVRLVRNADYWARARHEKEGRWTYGWRILRPVATPEERLEAVKKGRLGYATLTKEQWVAEVMDGKLPDNLVAVKAPTRLPQAYDLIAWNHRHPALYTRRVRWAMAHLIDLDGWIQTFDRGLTEPAIGPFSPKEPYHDPALRRVPFDPKAAEARLDAAGWTTRDADGIRTAKGRRLEIDLVYPAQGPGQYGPKIHQLAEAAKKVGVLVRPIAASWAEIEERLERRRFGGIVLARSRTLDASLRRSFHQSEIKDGDNFVGYKSARADQLIEELDAAFDPKARVAAGRALQRQIYDAQPYAFLTEYKELLYVREARWQTPGPAFPYQVGLAFWR